MAAQAPAPAIGDPAALRRDIEGLLAALDADDERAFRSGLEALIHWRERALVKGLSQVALGLRSALREVELDERLAQAAASDIPDARARLDAVVRLTEDAAQRTLGLAEDAREHVGAIDALAAGGDPETWQQVAQHVSALRGILSALSEAQAYQDLSGQIIRRVTEIVGRLEGALATLLKIAGIPVDAAGSPAPSAAGGLAGPAVHGLQTADTATQDDADALLADLGL